MAARLISVLVPLVLSASRVSAQQTTVTAVTVPGNLSSRVLLKDVYGYSLEPVGVADYLQNDLASTLMGIITELTGIPPPFRVGGNTADQTYLHDHQAQPSIASPNASDVATFNITPSWFDSWSGYFPAGTDFVYTLNFADNSSDWANAVVEAQAVHTALGSSLKLFELGNEVDHFMNKGWRGAGWGVAEYIPQWRNLSGQIVDSDWYKSVASPPKFQAGVFADPPWVPDQQDEVDDFDIVNLTKAGLVDHELISTYCVHLYPQSTCDTERWYRMRLDLLSNHTALWLNVSQYVPQVAAADAVGTPLVLGETNSISCSGRSGISDTFGAALWGVDYVLMAASIGIQKVYFHLGSTSDYSSFIPVPFVEAGENLTSGIRPGFYAHYFIAAAVAGPDNYTVAALPGANSSDLSGYGIYGSGGALQKMVFLDMGIWNTSEGLSNPSTLSATDSTSRSNGTRPQRQMQVRVPWHDGAGVVATRLNGPGTNAKSEVNVGGVTFDMQTGKKQGTLSQDSLSVDDTGNLDFILPRAGAILLELAGSGGGGGVTVIPPSSASRYGLSTWWISAVVTTIIYISS